VGRLPHQGNWLRRAVHSPRRRLLTAQAARSKMAAMPWPPPMHMVTRAPRAGPAGGREVGGGPWAAADAHGDQGAAAAGALELVEGLDGEDAAGGADRVGHGPPRPAGGGGVLGAA